MLLNSAALEDNFVSKLKLVSSNYFIIYYNVRRFYIHNYRMILKRVAFVSSVSFAIFKDVLKECTIIMCCIIIFHSFQLYF